VANLNDFRLVEMVEPIVSLLIIDLCRACSVQFLGRLFFKERFSPVMCRAMEGLY